jgi:FkbM family methyltransferase
MSLKSILRAAAPAFVRNAVAEFRRPEPPRASLDELRRRMFAPVNPAGSVEECYGFRVRINDGPNYYSCYKDIFQERIYHFTAASEAPRILDCGSNIGMSILYWKHVYPQASILGFEADRGILPILHENMSANRLKDVSVVEAALAADHGSLRFYADGKHSSTTLAGAPQHEGHDWPSYEVRTVPLADYLDGPVDFMKMNIEGAEWPVLQAAAGRLRQIREMVIEYHHLPGLSRTLHDILALLHENGFEYLINDFDPEVNPGTAAPFSLGPGSRYFLLIYAKRLD